MAKELTWVCKEHAPQQHITEPQSLRCLCGSERRSDLQQTGVTQACQWHRPVLRLLPDYFWVPAEHCSHMPCPYRVRQSANEVKFQNLLSLTEHLNNHVDLWFYNPPRHVMSSPYQLLIYSHRQQTCWPLIPAKRSSMLHLFTFSS